jgi:opacity protein-like surface antigen
MKRALIAALVAMPCLMSAAYAEDAPDSPPATPHTHRTGHHRVTWQQKFAAANVAHNGHLTADEAKAGYKSVFTHFAEIDVGNHGYVTLEDIKAWHKQKHAGHVSNRQNPLHPHHAFLHTTDAPPLHRTSTTELVPGPTDTVAR